MREIRYHHEPGELPPSRENTPFLHGLDSELTDQLLSNAVLLECEPGDKIITEGDSSKFFCVVLRGSMDIVKDGKVVGQLNNAGELVGELALAADTARTASVIANDNAFCLKIEPKFLRDLDDAGRNAFYAVLYKFVSKILSDRLAESSKKIAKLEKKLLSLGGDIEQSGGEPDVYRL